ncbi:MAG: hypothetical protein JWP25_7601 [Bradyrhizobium sp.]|nr:hypothetical protein [Bradyrhizobium sp.]
MTMQSWRTLITALILAVVTAPVVAESPYPTPTRDGRERIQRTGSCPTGYVGKGDKCEALHTDTPRAYPKIEGRPCPSGTFQSGDACKAFR